MSVLLAKHSGLCWWEQVGLGFPSPTPPPPHSPESGTPAQARFAGRQTEAPRECPVPSGFRFPLVPAGREASSKGWGGQADRGPQLRRMWHTLQGAPLGSPGPRDPGQAGTDPARRAGAQRPLAAAAPAVLRVPSRPGASAAPRRAHAPRRLSVCPALNLVPSVCARLPSEETRQRGTRLHPQQGVLGCETLSLGPPTCQPGSGHRRPPRAGGGPRPERPDGAGRSQVRREGAQSCSPRAPEGAVGPPGAGSGRRTPGGGDTWHLLLFGTLGRATCVGNFRLRLVLKAQHRSRGVVVAVSLETHAHRSPPRGCSPYGPRPACRRTWLGGQAQAGVEWERELLCWRRPGLSGGAGSRPWGSVSADPGGAPQC